MPDGSVTTRHGSSPQSGSSSRPPRSTMPRRDGVGVVAGLEPDVEVQPVLGRPLGGRLGAQLEEGTAQRRVAQGPGATPTTSVQPVSQDQNSASRSGSAESSGSAAIGPGVGVLRSILHDAAGIALRVGEHHPGHIALTDVEVSCAQAEQPLDLLGLAGPAAEVQVEPRGSGAAARGRAGSTGRAPVRPRW